ncbi:hypothetical protein DVH24_008179 [Malus domestica]|uniref:Uncharacterized protein n=1 Tax=Malus domestica TaxID=3750 RepID=A0A498JIH1_MALDO|nr:hypothetical protein DVH24_008179 [Malus domestica]
MSLSPSRLSLISHFSPSSLHCAHTHAPISPREGAHHPSSPRPALSLSLSLPLVPATPENRKRSSGEIFQSPVRTKSKPGVSTPNSGDLRGFSGHLRPFHDERKV